MKTGKAQALELVDGFNYVTFHDKESAKRLLQENVEPETVMRLLGEINAARNLLYIYEADILRRDGIPEPPSRTPKD